MIMGTRFSLDASSFEKLLAAAWILQCQQDEKIATTRQMDASRVMVLDHAVESVVGGASGTEEKVCPAPQESVLPAEGLPSAHVEPSGLIAAVEKSDNFLAEPLPSAAPAPSNPVVITALHAMASAAEDQAMAEIGRWFSIILLAINSRVRWFDKKTVRLVVSKRSLRLARVSIAPVLLLFVMFAFSVSQVWKQKAAQASQRIELQSSASAVTDSLQAHETRFAESLMVHEDEVRNEELIAQRPSSHLHITDSTAASAVQALSPYEITTLRRQAEYGDHSAALALGMAYETGHSVHQSCTKAAEWIAFAAANENPAAEYNLGLRYFQGDGLPQDATEGAKWLARAMAAGYPKVVVAEKHSSE
jgi:Sel1 repeat